MKNAGGTKKDKQDREAVIIIAVVVAIVVSIFGFNIHQAGEAKRYDDRMCRTDRPLEGITAILIDKSDPMTDAEVTALQRRIRQISDKLRRNELLAIYILDGDNANNVAERFCLCNPGQGSSANVFFQNPAFIQQKYDTSFGAPLVKALSVLKSAQSTAVSPIIEAVRALADIDEFHKTPKHRSIVLISDMLQNTPLYSQYSNKITYDAFAKSEYGQKMLPSLKDVTVDIEYVSQTKYKDAQTPEHQQFWKDFFGAAGAKEVILNIVGDSGLTGVSIPPDVGNLPPVPFVSNKSGHHKPVPHGMAGAVPPAKAHGAAGEVASDATEAAPPLAGTWSGQFDGNHFAAQLGEPVLAGGAWKVSGDGSMTLDGSDFSFSLGGTVKAGTHRVDLRTSNGFALVGSLNPQAPSMAGQAWRSQQPGVAPRSWELSRN